MIRKFLDYFLYGFCCIFIPLQQALATRQVKVIDLFLSVLKDYPETLKINLENETNDGFMPLPEALKSGNTAIVDKLFQAFKKPFSP